MRDCRHKCFVCGRFITTKEWYRGDFGVSSDHMGFLRYFCYNHPVVGKPLSQRKLFLGER